MPKYTVSEYGRNWLFKNPSMYSQERSFKAYGAEFTCGQETVVDFYLPTDDKRFTLVSAEPYWSPIALYTTGTATTDATQVAIPYHEGAATLTIKNTETDATKVLSVFVNSTDAIEMKLYGVQNEFVVELPRHLVSCVYVKSDTSAGYMVQLEVAAPKY